MKRSSLSTMIAVSDFGSDSATRFYVVRSDCPKCEPHPDKPSGICPYHKAKELLDVET